jgi:hypothetical protein
LILVSAIALVTPILGVSAAEGGGSWQTVVGSQRISEDTLFSPRRCQPHTETEPYIATDPNDPRVIVAVFQVGRCDGGAAGIGYSTSLDGGRTWIAGVMPKLTKVTGGPYDRGDDPAVAFGPDGRVYVIEMGFDQIQPCRSAVLVQRSDDHGLTFGKPIALQDACNPFNDKTWIAVDTFASSPHIGRIYAAWLALGPRAYNIVEMHSDDGGETWSRFAKVSPPGLSPEGAFPVVQPNGDLTIEYLSVYPWGPIVAQTSHDGGDHFDAPVRISNVVVAEPKDLRTGAIPSAAVDPVTADLYVAWADGRFGSNRRADILLSTSSDAVHWSAPVMVNPPSGQRLLDHFTPAVAAYGGTVHVSYYTRERAPGRYDVVYANETTATQPSLVFGPQVTLGVPGDLEFAARSGNDRFLGDYTGLTASAESVHAVWSRPYFEPGQPDPLHQAEFSAAILP